MPTLNRKTSFLFILLVLLTILLGFATNVLSEDFDEWCVSHFGQNYKPWLFGILIAGTFLALYFTTDFGKALFSKSAADRPIPLSPEETQQNYVTIRQYLLGKRYRPRLQQKLAGDQLFNLRVKPTSVGASPEKAATFVTLQGRKTGEEIRQIFEQARRRLLVTGLPGAGKTSLLLHLAIELLETDQDNLTAVLNLATWNSSFGTLDDWLREILPAELGITKRYAADILQQGKLTLLLDGLDEVDEAHRASCIDAIKGYGGKGRKDYVISTRKDEYKALEKDAPVWAQIEVLPLTKTQLLAQLDHADRRDFPEAPDLKAALENDPLLLKVAETPFYLNCLQLLFRSGSTLSDLGFKSHEQEKREVEIVERFVGQALAKNWKDKTPGQIRHWLAFLASRMTQRNKVVFELVDLQYDWWKWGIVSKIFAYQFKALASIVTSLFFITVFAHFLYFMYLLTALFSTSLVELRLNFSIFIIFEIVIFIGIFFPIINRRKNLKILTFEFSTFLLSNEILLLLIIAICMGILITGLTRIVSGNITGIILGTLSTLIIGMHFIGISSSIPFLQITTPYQRFTASAKALHFSILQHWLLRWQLYRAGVLPLRLVDFLNEMTKRHLLETDEATWRFRHRILQEYFAGHF